VRRTASSEGRESWVFHHAGVPPKAGQRSCKSGTEVKSEEAGVAEDGEYDGDGEIVRNAVEKQVTNVSL